MPVPRVAIIGADTLLGRELKDRFSTQAPDIDLSDLGSDLGGAILTERGGEPAVVPSVAEQDLEKLRAVILSGSPAASLEVVERVSRLESPPTLIDLTYALEDRPDARLGAPLVESETHVEPGQLIHVMAHPAATALALFFGALRRRHQFRRAVVQIFEPASERGRAGFDELHQQTVRVLSFKSVPTEVFGEQLCFNLLAQYGDEAPETLAEIESRIERHLATLLARGKTMPMPSLRLIQAPVFHGYCFSVWVEFHKNPGASELTKTLSSDWIELATEEEGPPTNLSVAQHSALSVGRMETDSNDARAVWFWVAVDNHRLAADSTVRLTRLLIGGEQPA